MDKRVCERTRASRLVRLAAIVACASLAIARPIYGQMSAEEHAKHHPGQAGPPGAAGKEGGMAGMMEGMMEKMGAPKPKELYPRLMDLPGLPPEERDTIEHEAHQRMIDGGALLSEGIDQLSNAAPSDDFAAMQAATAKMREGLSQFESGLAAHRALAEGKAPRNVALQWFKHEMNLLPAAGSQPGGFRFWGMTAFHTAVMGGLALFAVAMIGMYYFKMQRASHLLQDLTGGAAPSLAARGIAPVRAAPSAADQSPTGSAQPAVRKWSGKLRVAQIFQETPDVKTFRLMNPLGGVLPFSFLPGQFVTLTVTTDGKPVKRGYTIASSPTQHDYLEITVKHKEAGEVSGFLHSGVREGDLIECSGPSGAFVFTGRECKCILLIGGGVGITPLMSVLRFLTDRSWPGDIYLLYGCRTQHDIIFREELEYLQRRHSNLRVVITLSRPEGTEWKGPTGRLSKELISQSVPDLESRYVHICGPMPMMEGVKQMLAELGVPRERVKTEAFGPALGKPEPSPVAPGEAERPRPKVALPTVTFALSDKAAPLPPDQSVLEVADEIGVDIDNSCRVGTCGLCKVKLLSGQVNMAVEDALTPEDKAASIVLACQAKSTGNVEVEA